MSTGPRRLGKYELQRRLGRGGTAEVWKALDTQLQRHVAIKFLHADLRTDPNFMNRFIREAQVIASLHHPNIVRLHDFHAADSSESQETEAYMIMDYVEGMTLAEYIRDTSRVRKFPHPAEIVHLFTAIGSAIDYAHQRGMLHRDIKPANILLDKRRSSRYQMGEPILTDFGIVKLMGASMSTLTGSLVGTPSYISPEQARGLPSTERSDIYSLGVVLYEICTGVRPFQGDNPSVVMVQHIYSIPTPPHLINPGIPEDLSEIILHSLAKDPAARFPTALSMVAQMSEVLNRTTSLNSVLDTSGGSPYRTLYLPDLTPLPNLTSAPLSSPDVLPPVPFGPQLNETIALDTEQNVNMTPADLPLEGISIGSSSRHSPDILSPQIPPPRRSSRKRATLVISIVLLLLMVTGAILGTVLLRSNPNSRVTVNANPPSVGQASYVNSELVNQNDSKGTEDTLQINLSNIRAPSPGKSYYAWLLSDTSQRPMMVLSLGSALVDNGMVHISYPGDAQHTNLLALYSRFLITEDSRPIPPSSDQHTWRYYAELPQTPGAGYNNYSALDYLRHLLCEEQDQQLAGKLHGGLITTYLRNVKQISEWAVIARNALDNNDPVSIRQQSVRILAYIDSEAYVYLNDVPANTPLGVDPAFDQVPMLYVTGASQIHATYSLRVNDELQGLLGAPGIMPNSDEYKFASQADAALENVYKWLDAVHKDAAQLVKMSTTQLLQSSTLAILNDMENQANFAYNGQTDLATNKFNGGIAWISENIQNLAMFDVKAYP